MVKCEVMVYSFIFFCLHDGQDKKEKMADLIGHTILVVLFRVSRKAMIGACTTVALIDISNDIVNFRSPSVEQTFVKFYFDTSSKLRTKNHAFLRMTNLSRRRQI